MLDKLGDVTDVSLAVSLHAPTNELRDKIVPINKKYPIEELVAACKRYLDKCDDKRGITFEYTMLRGVNDQPEHAKALVKVLRQVPCKLNLIPFNPFPNSGYERSTDEAIKAFQSYVSHAGIVTTVRTTRGDDIDAACGQLVGKVDDRTRRSERYIKLVDQSLTVRDNLGI